MTFDEIEATLPWGFTTPTSKASFSTGSAPDSS